MAKEFKRGIKKGGTIFPKYSLEQILPNLKDLISKTHTKTINIEQLNSGVFKVGAKSVKGQIRYSALKQYGLAEGKYETIKSTELASKIVHSIDEEKILFIRQAFFNVQTFRNTFETYQNSTTKQEKIKGYVSSTLNVHPDSTNKFLESFLESAKIAKLCTTNGDEITFTDGKDIQFESEDVLNLEDEGQQNEQSEFKEEDKPANNLPDTSTKTDNNLGQTQTSFKSSAPTIEFKIDSSLDPEKLEKHLELLRKFGLV